MSLNKNAKYQEREEESSNQDSTSSISRLLLSVLVLFLFATCLYIWDAEGFSSETAKLVEHKHTTQNITSLRPPTLPTTSPVSSDASSASNPTETPTVSEGQDDAPTPSPPSGGSGIDFESGCSDICTKREANRKNKFGGDLLDFQDLVRLARAAHEKLQSALRKDYGEYFDRIFGVNRTDDGTTRYRGMRPPTIPNTATAEEGDPSKSKERMRRKMKLKVLKMMASVKETESNVHGCDCIEKNGSVNPGVDEGDDAIPSFYGEQYVFANGGHSNAAGHGNIYDEAYTAVFGRDVRPIWEAIGIEMIDRNYAMGAMRATPFMSCCAKEVFGMDVDFLAWNYGMTDGKPFSTAHYIYRGALIPSHPAIVMVDASGGDRIINAFEEVGLAMFISNVDGSVVQEIPDMTPDEIPISDEEAKNLAPMVRDLKCNGRLEGKEGCFQNKWSCTEAMLEAGVDCICPHVGKRSSWHMGYRMHALHGHLISLPFVEMLLEALKQLAEAAGNGQSAEQLLVDLQKEEDAQFQEFMESPLVADILADNYDVLGKPTDPLYETWFRGHSVCRTSYLPSQSRYLGLMTDSGKTGNATIYTHETYDTGDFYYASREQKDGNFTFLEDKEPPSGKFSIAASERERSGAHDIAAWEAECPAVVMPDYKDSLYAPMLNGKASIAFPNQKEREHFGYDPKKFKGIIAVILMGPQGCKRCPHTFDLTFNDFKVRNATMAVNSKPVRNIRIVSGNAMILEGDNGNVFWEPDPQTQDFTIEFQVSPKAAIYHLRVGNIILM
ncbi:MAG: hypothetical protein SGBAC_004886 [Bacillariaceae sp.]